MDTGLELYPSPKYRRGGGNDLWRDLKFWDSVM